MKRLLKWLLGILAVCAALVVAAVGIFVAQFWAPDRPVETLVARWAQPPSQFVMIDGLNVHLRDEGPRADPEPIVLIHGTSASLHTWDGWTAALSKTRRVIRFDLPGFGLTGPNADGDYRVERYGEFVLSVMNKLGVSRAVIAGNSLGGHVALVLALTKPERVSKLVLIDASGYPLAPTSIPLGFKLSRLPIASQISRVTLPRRIVEDSVRNVYGDPRRVTPELVDRYVELTLREGNRRALSQRMRLVLDDALTERIPSITLPTLILWGAKDHLIPVEAAKRFAQDIVGSELVIFEGLGHVPHEEDAEATVAAFQKFLSKAR
jgi:pimeloyl-ACP methyl ester carboxylesterase